MRLNLSTARQRVADLREALLNPAPERIEACLPGLVEAASCIEKGDLNTLFALKNDLKRVKSLLQHGEMMNRGLARLLGAEMAGYTRSGEAAPISAAGTVSLKG